MNKQQKKDIFREQTMTIDAPKIKRRRFLQWAGAAGVLAIPTLFGYTLLRATEGESPHSLSPYDIAERPENSLSLTSTSPVLLLTNERSHNPFGTYLAEILRAEGLNCFQVADISAVDKSSLEQFALVLLAEGTLDKTHMDLLETYVAKGGRLIAMRPEIQLGYLFGLESLSGTTAEGYLKVAADQLITQGLNIEALQFHGTADHYRLAGAQAVAWLTGQSGLQADFPAVTLYQYGQGQAALWAFDLAQSVVYTRQGNPALANQEMDGREGIRALDAFVGWLDLDRIAIPQADEQMRLLSRLIGEMLSDLLPLPRLWYFPGAAKTMLIPTGDSHANPATAIETVLLLVEQRGGHMSIYYTPPPSNDWKRAVRKVSFWAADLPLVGNVLANYVTAPTPSLVADWRARGHEFSLHPYVEEGLEAGWRLYWKEFTGLGLGPVSPTVRTHRVLWQGWVETARIQASYGLGMNFDYYHFGPAFQNKAGEWPLGYFTGSGLPMKFMDEQGRVLNIYQQLTQLVDEHLLKIPWGANGWLKLDADTAAEVSRTLLRRSLDGAYSAIATQFHVDAFANDDFAPKAARWLEGTLDYAVEQGIPIWSAERWLRFTEVRHDAVMEKIQWHSANRSLSFQLLAQAISNIELTIMVPLRHGEAKLVRVEVEGQPITYHEQQVGGISYGGVPVRADSHKVVAYYA